MLKSQAKSKRKKRQLRRKRLFRNIAGVVIITALAFIASVLLKGYFSSSGKYVLGFQSYITLSGSMSPVIRKGSLVITRRVKADAIKIGDIITYKDDDETLTQRVVDIADNNGSVSFITAGDANEGVNSRPASADNIIGRFVYAVSFAGSVMLAMRNPAVMAVCVIAACALAIAADAANRRIKKRLRRKKGHGGPGSQNNRKPPDIQYYNTGIDKRQRSLFLRAIYHIINTRKTRGESNDRKIGEKYQAIQACGAFSAYLHVF